MAFVRVPDPNLDTGKPGRSVDIKQIRDNQDDHEARIIAVEDASGRTFSHFAGSKGFNGGGAFNDKIIAGGGVYIDYDGFFLQADAGEVYSQIGVSGAADDHYLKWDNGAGAAVGQIIAESAMNFANRTKPITFTMRAKMSDTLNNVFHMGLTDRPVFSADSVPADGIWLEQGSAANNWRFKTTSSVGGGITTGTDIPWVSGTHDNVWFECKIVFTNDPGNRALCYLDGGLKETFTTANALATTVNLYGRWTWNSGAGDKFYVDRCLVSASGSLVDVP